MPNEFDPGTIRNLQKSPFLWEDPRVICVVRAAARAQDEDAFSPPERSLCPDEEKIFQ